jgi:hypothetical protein
MVKSATNPNDTQRFALQDWLSVGYTDNAAISLEYAMADFAIAQFGGALGNTAVHDQFMTRSDNWRQSWNADQGFIEPRVSPTSSTSGGAARIYEVAVFGPDAPMADLALAGTATASATCNDNETADKAINGSISGGTSDKWCDNTSADKWWQLDLGAEHTLSVITIDHSGAGGETPDWNTQTFTVSVSTDATNWVTVVDVKNNKDNVTTNSFDPISARYVRLDVIHAEQMPIDDGIWTCQNPFDPSSDCGFIEGNAAQYLWLVPQNLEGLFTDLGGHSTAVARLDNLFTELNAGTNRPFFYIGNEPEHGVPWAYNFARNPAGTARAVHKVMTDGFNTSAGGLPGNDDLGATSAWYVWAALGMYPATPGADTLALHGPTFPSILIQRTAGNISISAPGVTATNSVVQSVALNGAATTHSFVRYPDVAAGATLTYTMGTAASTWGTAAGDVPPSFTAGATPPAAAPALGTNLARGMAVTASAACATAEAAANAVDGSLANNSKWCSLTSQANLQIDLGSVQTVGSFVVKHAGLGGETTGWNTGAFAIDVSTDGSAFTTVVNVSGSRASRTFHAITARQARFVRFRSLTPTNNGNTATRIYEVEVYATSG